MKPWEKVMTFLFVTAILVGIILGGWWLIWLLWTWVWPRIWPSGPQGFIQPSYWLFAGIWVLIALVANMFRNSGGKGT